MGKLQVKNSFLLKACSSVDRVSDSDSESQGFDSLHAYSSAYFIFAFYFNNFRDYFYL